MKIIHILSLLACLLFSVDASAQAILSRPETGSLAVDTQDGKAKLQLKTTVIEQKYCGTSHLRITLFLHYTNTGTRPIILSRYSLAVSRYMVSRNITEAEAKKYVEDVSPMINPIVRLQPGELLPDKDHGFVILQPGESYTPELEAQIDLSFIYDGVNIKEGGLHPGDYVLEFVVLTWYGSSELANTLRERWEGVGFLWTKPMKSPAIPFKVEKQRSVVNCSQ